MHGFAPRVKAVLGPTNTGKTHLAMERLMAHASGIIGFPLRLLARENYDRMVAARGVRNVALITGEEKIVPPGASWFSCTVEAMPLDRPVEFIAVDEIQLCADPDRGHVFTDRLLHARGMVETMFLGADTIRPLLRRLVPQAEVETRPRLSQLAHAGPVKLVRLPPRSAVVAFSASEVYAIAELIRRRRGGCAVVMGRLSPRTRNAQVALYQAKEVDFLVATDAIGMGLNMDVDHVAFARLSKFDGHRPRRLAPAEVAQIAGRAGRGMRDGTFGSTAECPPLSEELVHAVETHHFDALEQLCWRNTSLDFSNLDALIDTLMAPPPRPGLVRGNDASDLTTLAALAREPTVRGLATSPGRLRLLWEACQIPDFRKFADDSHTRLCERVFGHVVRDGRVPADWIGGQIDALDRPEGDIDTLMQRLSGIRVWAYIAARSDWVADPAHFQGRARVVEERLSDALHERLISRFVDRRSTHLLRRLEATDEELLSAVTRRGDVVVEGHPVGQVAGFFFHPDPLASGEEKRLVLRAARRALREEIPRRVIALEAAPDAVFATDADHRILWNGHPVARLRPGNQALRPRVEVMDSAFLDGAQRERIRLRLQRFCDETVASALSPLFDADVAPGMAPNVAPALRGPLHRLREALGVVPGPTEPEISPAQRAQLKAAGIRAGRFALFMPALLKPRPMAMRAALLGLANGVPTPKLPAPSLVTLPLPHPSLPDALLQALGWVAAGPVWIRLDMAERTAAELAWLTRAGPVPIPADLAARLSLRVDLLPAVLRGLGVRVLPGAPLAAEQYGPPAPAMMAPRQRRAASQDPPRRPPPRGAVPGNDARNDSRPAVQERAAQGPFAALAALHARR